MKINKVKNYKRIKIEMLYTNDFGIEPDEESLVKHSLKTCALLDKNLKPTTIILKMNNGLIVLNEFSGKSFSKREKAMKKEFEFLEKYNITLTLEAMSQIEFQSELVKSLKEKRIVLEVPKSFTVMQT